MVDGAIGWIKNGGFHVPFSSFQGVLDSVDDLAG